MAVASKEGFTMSSSGKRQILLVEDTNAEAHLYQEYLRREPVEVIHVGTSAEARRAIDERIPDLILLDMQLPDGNGIDLLNELRAEQMPVTAIVITAHGSVNVAVQAMQAAGLSDAYAEALRSGIWPSEDVLPKELRR